MTRDPKTVRALYISCILCLPFAYLFTMLMLQIEPNFGPLQPLLDNPDPDQPDVLGSLIAIGSVLLVLVAFVINLNQVMQAVRAGGSVTTHLVNFMLALITLAAITVVIGGIVVDQYPCWIGVPNCD